MKSNSNSRRRPQSQRHQNADSHDGNQFHEMPDPLLVVEHLTIAGFIRRAPHRFHMDEIMRFGDKVARIAESLQVSYLTAIDRQLGQVRLFPVPLLTRVYQVMASQFGWEQIMDVTTIEGDNKPEMLRSNERAKKHLQAAAGNADIPQHVADAMATAIGWLESETIRLKEDGAVAPAEPPPLRAL